MNIPEYSVHLDAVRGDAALVVFSGHVQKLFLRPFFHTALVSAAGGAISTLSAQAQAPHLELGHEAVMVFFVLSGFLVGGSTIRVIKSNSWTWKEYLLQRLTRMWMVLIPALVLGLLDNLGLFAFSGTSSIYTRTLESCSARGQSLGATESNCIFRKPLFFARNCDTNFRV